MGADRTTTYSTADTVRRLRESLDTLEWAVSILPERWHQELPTAYPEDFWSVAMNVAHLVVYEESIANPVMAALAAGGDGVGSVQSANENWFLQDARSISGQPLDQLMERLRKAHERGLEIVESFDPAEFNQPVTPLFSSGKHGSPPHSPGWVATKTFQHRWEHGNAVLRMTLFAPP